MAIQLNVHETKTQLSKLLVSVEAGEEIIIARGGKPVARLVPMEPRSSVKIGLYDHLGLTISDEQWVEFKAEQAALYEGPNWLDR